MSSFYACSLTPVCIYTVLSWCAEHSQVMFTPTDTSSTPPPTKTHTHSLALISCLAHRCLAPRAMLTSIRHTPSPLQFRSWSGFTFLFCDIWSEALSQLHTSYKRNTQNDVNVKAAPVWTLYLYVVLVLCVPVTNRLCAVIYCRHMHTHFNRRASVPCELQGWLGSNGRKV